MERDGIVRRNADTSDGRAQRISLTTKGKSRISEVKAAMLDVVEQALAGVSQRERNVLTGSLRKVVQNLSE